MLSGNNGVLQRATDAKTKSDEAQIKERIQLAYHSALTGGKGSYTKESLENELKNEFGENNYDVNDDSDKEWVLSAKVQGREQSVTIPAGIKIKIAILQGAGFYQGGNLVQAYNNGSIYQQITGVLRSSTKPSDENMTSNHLWSTSDSEYPVYFWVTDNVLYYWTEADVIKLNKNCTLMFASWEKLQDVSGIKEFDTSQVENMQIMFGQCKKITTIDLSNWDTSKVKNMGQMFGSCESLTTIYVSEKFVTDSVTDSSAMFGNCVALVGGKGTVYDSSKMDATMAQIDTAVYENGTLVSGVAGYFTAK